MNYKLIKEKANIFLTNRENETSFIEYKKNDEKLASVLKTICAFANNYMDNDYSYIFLGVEEENDDNNKAIPITPIYGVKQGKLEIVKNKLLNLKSYIYPKVNYEVVYNTHEGIDYILVVVPRQLGGPFNVSEKAEQDYSLKPGRYVRLDAESRLAKVNEECNLLRKFSNYHFSSMTNEDATIDDIDISLVMEYLDKTNDRTINENLSKEEIYKSLELLDDDGWHIKNFAVLMFTARPEKYIDNAYVELIADINGDKKRMDSKTFNGPIWKQYDAIVEYINNQFLNSIIVREDDKALSRRVFNYPFTAIEELVANAIVHNNYENHKSIQIYILDKYISIVNYNKPLPPVSIADLNSKSLFIEKDFVNPEIRKMFKNLGIMESFGTGVGEAKLSLSKNGSPNLIYKEFDDDVDITSVVIPINEEYFNIKNGKSSESNENIFTVKETIRNSKYSQNIKSSLLKIYDKLSDHVFGNKEIVTLLSCSNTTATDYIKKFTELSVVEKVTGRGPGKYIFKD